MRPCKGSGTIRRASVSTMERGVSFAKPDIVERQESLLAPAEARRSPVPLSRASALPDRTRGGPPPLAPGAGRPGPAGRRPGPESPGPARGQACGASQPAPGGLTTGWRTVLCLLGFTGHPCGARDHHAVPSHRTELPRPCRDPGASDLDEYPPVFIDFFGGRNPRSLVRPDPWLLGLGLGALRCIPRRQ